MRISKEQAAFFRNFWGARADVYLFGSRTDDLAKGGDIDILLLSESKVVLDEKIDFIASFFEKFGEQKIDVVAYSYQEIDTFKTIAQSTAVRL